MKGKAGVFLGIFILLLLNILVLWNTLRSGQLPMVLLPSCRRNETREEKGKRQQRGNFNQLAATLQRVLMSLPGSWRHQQCATTLHPLPHVWPPHSLPVFVNSTTQPQILLRCIDIILVSRTGCNSFGVGLSIMHNCSTGPSKKW